MCADNSAKDQTTTSILLAEHQRLAALYQHNSDMGDKLVATYLTIVSVMVAVMLGIIQLETSQLTLIPVELILIMVMMCVGAITYARLLERRARSVEYLRAINRIHRFFVEKDENLLNYLYWQAYDDRPPVKIGGTSIGGLRDMVALINSVVAGLGVGIFLYSLNHSFLLWFLILISCFTMVIFWYAHQWVKNWKLRQIECKLEKEVKYHTP